ncbi:hypothetical protein Pcinc_003153 [Petrolisthes cinctipes]|uniref:Uncharacterized protein n=1 Tax=Petrolisthes cinctipes TaxID=88211 RepID=A0AAE1L1J8_PETCI|nr:hypothetical protein Pcinc_003153 [Petrolisthes cinctipes]
MQAEQSECKYEGESDAEVDDPLEEELAKEVEEKDEKKSKEKEEEGHQDSEGNDDGEEKKKDGAPLVNVDARDGHQVVVTVPNHSKMNWLDNSGP